MTTVLSLGPNQMGNPNIDSPANLAADEIINAPEKHLLTMSALLEAEGGSKALMMQAGATFGGLVGLFSYQPQLLKYLRNSQLRAVEFVTIGGVALASYKFGRYLGISFFGDQEKVRNHWMAYYYVKQCNRYLGARALAKAPMFW